MPQRASAFACNALISLYYVDFVRHFRSTFTMFDRVHPIPAFTDNYIWALIDTDAAEACVVDPGDAAPVLEFLVSEKLSLRCILITHHHPDHTGGLVELSNRFSAPVYGPRNPRIVGITHPLQEGDELELFGASFSVLEVPGHTLDHIAYYSTTPKQPVLYCGDTLFAAGCGRLFEGTPQQMLVSLNKLSSLPPETLVYCTHEYTLANLRFALAAEPANMALQERAEKEQQKRDQGIPTLPSNIGLELATNPFLRCENQELRERVAGQSQLSLDNATSTFAALRQWKDNF